MSICKEQKYIELYNYYRNKIIANNKVMIEWCVELALMPLERQLIVSNFESLSFLIQGISALWISFNINIKTC